MRAALPSPAFRNSQSEIAWLLPAYCSLLTAFCLLPTGS